MQYKGMVLICPIGLSASCVRHPLGGRKLLDCGHFVVGFVLIYLIIIFFKQRAPSF